MTTIVDPPGPFIDGDDPSFDIVEATAHTQTAPTPTAGELVESHSGRVNLANKYILEQEIGRGAMGRVYQALQLGLNRRVAVKLMSSMSVGADFRRRFVLEAQALAGLNHRHIVRLYDAGQTESGLLYIVLELLHGEPLLKKLRREGPLPVLPALHLAMQLARGLRAAHRAGFVHRDLKPNNVFMIDEDDTPVAKILDFGIAKLLDQGEHRHERTRDGLILGTPAYMAPEQINGRGVDGRTDIYALGCLMYRTLAGRPPFEHSTEIEVLAAQLKQAPTPLHLLPGCQDIPPSVEQVILRCLEKEPAARHQDMDALIVAMRDAARPKLEQEAGLGADADAADHARHTAVGAPVARMDDEELFSDTRELEDLPVSLLTTPTTDVSAALDALERAPHERLTRLPTRQLLSATLLLAIGTVLGAFLAWALLRP